ncbi:MAG: porin family protein [Bacteroidetes bacterium]|nr:porin family protein [Bacteroidota bacterium]
MIKKVLFLFAILAMVATTTNAQKIMLGPQLGYFAPSQEGTDGSILFGGAVRAKFGSLGIEGAINYRSETTEESGAELKASFYPVMVSALLYPLPIVYGIAGIGWYNYKIEMTYNGSSLGDYTDSEIGYHIGAGAEIPLGNIILAADLKYVFMKYQFENSNTDYDADGLIINATVFFGL